MTVLIETEGVSQFTCKVFINEGITTCQNLKISFLKPFKNTDIYNYSLVDYIHSQCKVKIICPEHGIFEQVPNSHLNGHSCPSCSYIIRTKNKIEKAKNEFEEKAVQKHGHIYDYSLVEYIKSNKKVKIICTEHGTFAQTPANHLNGNGCPSCACHGFNSNKSAIFYILKFNDQDLWKIGITNRTVNKRYSKSEREIFTIISTTKYN